MMSDMSLRSDTLIGRLNGGTGGDGGDPLPHCKSTVPAALILV